MHVAQDPHKRFVAAAITPAEYALLLQRRISILPAGMPMRDKVALAHLSIMEETITDPNERQNARVQRKKAEAAVAAKTSRLYIPGR